MTIFKRISIMIGLLLVTTTMAFADVKTHKTAFHVDESDPKVMNMALNNVQNVSNYYAGKGEKVIIELVAYGPGMNMFVKGKSPDEERISVMSMSIDDLQFSACGNTHRKMSEKAGKDVALIDGVGIVPSGVVRLVELQEQGYAYVRP
ncbi:DsrE family protein [Candidatus Ponderosibacter sp. Uisw_141_02]|uniref:DsrE family protein n=1 Tax=Candidatus Ponderosibacter sp. Uisw_141_02 TaxID=3231000 RepID=UPI003D413CC1